MLKFTQVRFLRIGVQDFFDQFLNDQNQVADDGFKCAYFLIAFSDDGFAIGNGFFQLINFRFEDFDRGVIFVYRRRFMSGKRLGDFGD